MLAPSALQFAHLDTNQHDPRRHSVPLSRIETMLNELLHIAREDRGESTFSDEPTGPTNPTGSRSITERTKSASEEHKQLIYSGEPSTGIKRPQSASGSSRGQTDTTGSSEGIDKNSESIN